MPQLGKGHKAKHGRRFDALQESEGPKTEGSVAGWDGGPHPLHLGLSGWVSTDPNNRSNLVAHKDHVHFQTPAGNVCVIVGKGPPLFTFRIHAMEERKWMGQEEVEPWPRKEKSCERGRMLVRWGEEGTTRRIKGRGRLLGKRKTGFPPDFCQGRRDKSCPLLLTNFPSWGGAPKF